MIQFDLIRANDPELCGYMEEHNRQLLVSAAKHFMTEEKN